MNSSKENYVSVNEILADVLVSVDDEAFKDHSKGFYVSQVQQALQELSFDTYFDERTEDFDVPSNLRLEMPKGAFNIKQIYLFNGTKCNIAKSQIVYHKRNYFTGGVGYVAKDKWNNRDPFYDSRSFHGRNRRAVGDSDSAINDLYFYNIQNGMMMFSSSISRFEKIMVVYNGISTDIGEVPIIPTFFREAVKSWVLDVAYKIKMARAVADLGKWQALWSMNNNLLRKPFTGYWDLALYRAKNIDSKEREDINVYIGRLDY